MRLSHEGLCAQHVTLDLSHTSLLPRYRVLGAQSRRILRNPMDCSPPGSSSVHGILQARILQWVAIPFSSRSSQPRGQTGVSCAAGRFFAVWATRGAPRCRREAVTHHTLGHRLSLPALQQALSAQHVPSTFSGFVLPDPRGKLARWGCCTEKKPEGQREGTASPEREGPCVPNSSCLQFESGLFPLHQAVGFKVLWGKTQTNNKVL